MLALPSPTAIIGFCAGVISFAAYGLYILSIIRGTTKPNRATWWILSLVGILIASSYYAGGARDTMWEALTYVVGPLIIAVLSLKKGEGSWETLDKVCCTAAIISAVIWYFSSSALLTLFINIGIDFLGIIPTLEKAFNRPEGEDRTAWMLTALAGTVNLFAIEKMNIEIAFYPIYLFIVNGVITFFLLRGKKTTSL